MHHSGRTKYFYSVRYCFISTVPKRWPVKSRRESKHSHFLGILLKNVVPGKIETYFVENIEKQTTVNPLRPNSDLSQTSHCNIKGVSVSEVTRIEKEITPVKLY